MPENWLWGLVASFLLLAIGTSLKAIDAVHAKKLSDDEVSRLRAKLDVLNNPTDEKTIDEQPINSNEVSIPQTERLEKIKEDILVLLAAHPGKQADFFAQATKVGSQVALHHLEAMQDKTLVSHYWRTNEWKLQPAGREYLVRHELIS